jgi:UDP-N-acetylmuramoyl-tripeptide--D-alanyl-D-alanine ligase
MLGLDESAELLLTELGSNHAGEIMELARWIKPDVGVVTNAGRAHIGLFGSLENVVQEKTDLLRALPPSGRGVVNADSPAVLQTAKEIDIDTVTFGIEADCDFRAVDIRTTGAGGTAPAEGGVCGAVTAVPGVTFTVRDTEVNLRAPGVHNVYNALAAIATGTLFDVGPAEAARVLREFEPVRVAVHTGGGITLIDDTYNANPDSVSAVLSVLTSAPAERKILVLGEMLELGDFSVDLHREVGARVASAGVDCFFGVGGGVMDAVDAARKAGMTEGNVGFFADKEAACAFLGRFVRQGDAVLVKGSRATGMDGISDFMRTSLMSRRN